MNYDSRVYKIMLGYLFVIGLFMVASQTVAAAACCFGDPADNCGSYFKRANCEGTASPAAPASCEWNPLCDPQSALEQVVVLTLTFVRWVPLVAIIIGTIYLIIGAFNYITAGEDMKKVEQARATIFYAVLGIALSTFLYLAAGILVDIIPRLRDYLRLR